MWKHLAILACTGTLMIGCATTPRVAVQPHHLPRIKTCLVEVAHIDPGPVETLADPRLEEALKIYVAQFAADDIMAMGRDPQGQEVQTAALTNLLYRCHRDHKSPASDPWRDKPWGNQR